MSNRTIIADGSNEKRSPTATNETLNEHLFRQEFAQAVPKPEPQTTPAPNVPQHRPSGGNNVIQGPWKQQPPPPPVNNSGRVPLGRLNSPLMLGFTPQDPILTIVGDQSKSKPGFVDFYYKPFPAARREPLNIQGRVDIENNRIEVDRQALVDAYERKTGYRFPDDQLIMGKRANDPPEVEKKEEIPADEMVYIRRGAVAVAVHKDKIKPDPTCHPDG